MKELVNSESVFVGYSQLVLFHSGACESQRGDSPVILRGTVEFVNRPGRRLRLTVSSVLGRG